MLSLEIHPNLLSEIQKKGFLDSPQINPLFQDLVNMMEINHRLIFIRKRVLEALQVRRNYRDYKDLGHMFQVQDLILHRRKKIKIMVYLRKLINQHHLLFSIKVSLLL